MRSESQVIQEAIDVLMGDYDKLFERESFKSIILDDRQPNESICLNLCILSRPVQPSAGLDNISAFLKTRVNAYIHFADTEAEEQLRCMFHLFTICRTQEVLHLAITLLNMYIQANYTGPGLEETFPSISTILPFSWFRSVHSLIGMNSQSSSSSDLSFHALQSLAIDGEEAYELMKHPLLLACAEVLLLQLHSMLLPASLRFWTALWLARCSVVHYRCLLGNPSPTLHKRIRSLQEGIEKE